MIDKHESPVEYESVADRLDAQENRIRLLRKTLHEVVAFCNALEERIAKLEAGIKDA